MRPISDLLEYIRPENQRGKSLPFRSVLRPDFGLEEYMLGKASAEDPALFDARCLYMNGWTAEMEGRFQSSSRGCLSSVRDGDALIIALEKIPGIIEAENKSRAEKRAEADRLLKEAREAEEAKRRQQKQQEPPPPPPYADDIPFDDDIPFNL